MRTAGCRAEARAATYLRSLGYTLLRRRFKGVAGEVDVLAIDGDALVVVEVKYRNGYGATPEESIDARKRQRVWRAAEEFMARSPGSARRVRGDVIAFQGDAMRHLIGALAP